MTVDEWDRVPHTPEVARILWVYREEVAQATEKALRALRKAGDPDPEATLLGRADRRPRRDA